MATRTLLHKNAKRKKAFSNINICLGGINKLYESKNRIINLTLNSRRVFENRHYFIVYKSYFGAGGRRQRGRVVRAPDLKSVGRGFKSRGVATCTQIRNCVPENNNNKNK